MIHTRTYSRNTPALDRFLARRRQESAPAPDKKNTVILHTPSQRREEQEPRKGRVTINLPGFKLNVPESLSPRCASTQSDSQAIIRTESDPELVAVFLELQELRHQCKQMKNSIDEMKDSSDNLAKSVQNIHVRMNKNGFR